MGLSTSQGRGKRTAALCSRPVVCQRWYELLSKCSVTISCFRYMSSTVLGGGYTAKDKQIYSVLIALRVYKEGI